jgi:hypothetical protein
MMLAADINHLAVGAQKWTARTQKTEWRQYVIHEQEKTGDGQLGWAAKKNSLVKGPAGCVKTPFIISLFAMKGMLTTWA